MYQSWTSKVVDSEKFISAEDSRVEREGIGDGCVVINDLHGVKIFLPPYFPSLDIVQNNIMKWRTRRGGPGARKGLGWGWERGGVNRRGQQFHAALRTLPTDRINGEWVRFKANLRWRGRGQGGAMLSFLLSHSLFLSPFLHTQQREEDEEEEVKGKRAAKFSFQPAWVLHITNSAAT